MRIKDFSLVSQYNDNIFTTAIFSMINKENQVVKLLNLIGGVTLEIYVANCICMKLQSSFEILNGILLYWGLNLLIAPMVIILNRNVNRAIEANINLKK